MQCGIHDLFMPSEHVFFLCHLNTFVMSVTVDAASNADAAHDAQQHNDHDRGEHDDVKGVREEILADDNPVLFLEVKRRIKTRETNRRESITERKNLRTPNAHSMQNTINIRLKISAVRRPVRLQTAFYKVSKAEMILQIDDRN
jgi:hypothetical protein